MTHIGSQSTRGQRYGPKVRRPPHPPRHRVPKELALISMHSAGTIAERRPIYFAFASRTGEAPDGTVRWWSGTVEPRALFGALLDAGLIARDSGMERRP